MRSSIRRLSPAVASTYPFLEVLGLNDHNHACYDGVKWEASGEVITPMSPINGKPIGPTLQLATPGDVARCIRNMMAAKRFWMSYPAPKRGEIVRQIGEELRRLLKPLGQLLVLEVGKVTSEGNGEVQEFVDVCDFATGLSRQLAGQVVPSERPGHFLMEQWHPRGAVGMIAAFNFPVAVPGWNTAISLVCGNTQIWKCAPTTNLTSLATQRIIVRVLERNEIPGAVATFVSGGVDVGEAIADSPDLPLVSFTGSCAAGAKVSERVARRFGHTLLELGGNNAIIVMGDADVDMALRSALFGAVGTCGQRCTTCRRLYLHESIYEPFVRRLAASYGTLRIGNPMEEGILVGPLHTLTAVKAFEEAIERARREGGHVLAGGEAFHQSPDVPGPNYVKPTLIAIDPEAPCVHEEVFVPILYVMKFRKLDEAIRYNNSVAQGLSSSLFTMNLRHAHQWTSALGSDCGLVNVNVPTNGAEIGGAFGGEKASGGGRESGSDAWKQYCRRMTTTINYSDSLPLAQGVEFPV